MPAWPSFTSPKPKPRDLPHLLDRVAAGDQVQIDKDSKSFKIVSMSEKNDQPRRLSEIIAAMKQNPYEGLLDDQFGNDLEEVIRLHEHERLTDPWGSF